MAEIAIIAGASLLSAGIMLLGVQWWRQGVPLGEGRTLTGGAARASGAAVILLGLAIGVFGWVWFPSLMR